MKKISLFIVSILLIIPFTVSAAEYKVVELNASSENTTIKYDGIMEAGSTAVMCKLYDSSSNELDYFSSAVDNTKFNGTFTAPKDGKYIVKCANYEGGDLKEATVTVGSTTSKSSKNPKTGDNILLYTSLMIISLLGISIISFRLRKNK